MIPAINDEDQKMPGKVPVSPETVLAKKIAARVIQRALRQNPTPAYFEVAIPIIALGIIEGRTDLHERASAQVKEMARTISSLERQLRFTRDPDLAGDDIASLVNDAKGG
jgi:hypothetical protein